MGKLKMPGLLSRAIAVSVVLLVMLGGALAARLKPAPVPCTCNDYVATTQNAAQFTYRDPQGNYPLEGWCDYMMFLFNEQYCPRERGCIGQIIGKGSTRMERTVVDTKPLCRQTLFSVYANPYLDRSTLAFTFRPSERIKHFVSHWFSSNVAGVTVSGVPFLRTTEDAFGWFLEGTVPANQPAGLINGVVRGFKDKKDVQIPFTITVAP
jgi:hypothetical protein